MTAEPSWKVVATYAALYEAELAAGSLANSGIPSHIDQRGGVGVFGPSHGGKTVRGVALVVPTDRWAEARDVLGVE